MVEVKSEEKQGKKVCYVSGRIDAVSAGAFDKESEEVFSDKEKVIVDFSGVEYISSAGIRVVMRWLKMKHKFVLSGVREEVKSVFEMTGVDNFLTVYETLGEALSK